MSDDLISRSALKRELGYTDEWYNRRTIRELIDNAPTVPNEYMRGYEAAERKYKRPQGEWVEDYYAGIHCSECDYFPLKDVVIKIHADGSKEKSGNYNLTPFCPNCGAKMKNGGDDMGAKEEAENE